MKKKLLGLVPLLGLAAFGLASCDSNSTPVDPKEEFEENDNPTVELPEMFVIGSHWNSWNTATIKEADPSCAFVLDTTSSGLLTCYVYTVTVTQEMIDPYCGFKFIGEASWNSQYGMEDVDYTKSNQAFKDMIGDVDESGTVDNNDKYSFHEGTSNRNNIVATLPGTFKISYYPYNFEAETKSDIPYSNKFVIEFTAA